MIVDDRFTGPPPRRSRTGAWVERVLTVLAYAVFGAITAVITTFAHRVRIEVAGVELWTGLVAGLLALLLISAGLRGYLDDRLPVVSFAVGAIGTVFVLSTPGIGQSVVIPGDVLGPAGTIWVYGSAAAAVLPAIWPKLPPRERPAAARGPAAQDAPSRQE
ncbi:MAG: hypothetical protein GXX90_01990 [Microbacteriaceae bacterium]|nr:hypothetical protein [Microbacteriaceae bacterium]